MCQDARCRRRLGSVERPAGRAHCGSGINGIGSRIRTRKCSSVKLSGQRGTAFSGISKVIRGRLIGSRATAGMEQLRSLEERSMTTETKTPPRRFHTRLAVVAAITLVAATASRPAWRSHGRRRLRSAPVSSSSRRTSPSTARRRRHGHRPDPRGQVLTNNHVIRGATSIASAFRARGAAMRPRWSATT